MIQKAVIDFSAFVGDNKKVIIKELSILDLESKCVQHCIFKPPLLQPPSQVRLQHDCGDWQQGAHNRWLTKHYHGLGFSTGSADYESLTNTLHEICRNIKLLYAASSEKAKVLENILNNSRVVFSLESLGCPPLSSDLLILPPSEDPSTNQCLFHHMYAPGFFCTQSNVHKLAEWCINNPAKVDMNNPTIREKTFEDWKLKSPSAQQIAEEGFVRIINTKDTTKCVYCGVTLYKWEEGDNPAEDHSYNSPFCSFIRHKEIRKSNTGKTTTRGDIPDECQYTLPFDVTDEDLLNLCKA